MNNLARFAVVATCLGSVQVASADPLRVALIDPLTGPLASNGKIYEAVMKYAIDKLNAAGGFNGEPIELITLDDAGNASVTGDRFREAVSKGAQIVIKSLTSATAGQLSEDVKRYNMRNASVPIIFLNQGAEASDLTGAKCHFYSFRLGTTAPMRAQALMTVMKDQGAVDKGVYSINQNYSLGQDMEAAVQRYSKQLQYEVVGSALHDMSRIQDFTPYVARIRESGASAVVTSSYGGDLLLLIKAAVDSGLLAKFGTIYLDQPGNLGSGGSALAGSYNAAPYNIEADPTGMPEDFKAHLGSYPTYHVQGHVMTVIDFVGAALKSVSGKKGDKVDTKSIALALEKTKLEGPMGELSMRAEDHQMMLPIAVSRVQEGVKYPVDGTELGFAVAKIVPAKDTIYPVQPECKMVRP